VPWLVFVLAELAVIIGGVRQNTAMRSPPTLTSITTQSAGQTETGKGKTLNKDHSTIVMCLDGNMVIIMHDNTMLFFRHGSIAMRCFGCFFFKYGTVMLFNFF